MPSTDRKQPPAGGRPRIALYSHDAMGLGHLRRNLLIAETLARPPVSADVLLVSGARELTAYPLPPGVDCLTLPALQKYPDGTYAPRNLALPFEDLIQLRSGQILQAMRDYRPDLLLVDKVPRGIFGELDPTLTHLRDRDDTRVVLGLRDVLDEPEVVRREWAAADNTRCLHDHYDEVWIYGDRALHDPLAPVDLGDELRSRVRFTGYLDPRRRTRSAPAPVPGNGRPVALCEVGGGQDGGFLAERFVEAGLPEGWEGLVLTGPFMPPDTRERLHRRSEGDPHLRLMEFVTDPDALVDGAERVVSMGGYNTLLEVVALGKPALVVPRISPRSEQAIRAALFRDLGLLDMLSPADATPGAIAGWLARPIAPRVDPGTRLDLEGLDRIPRLVEGVLGRRRSGRRAGGTRRWTA